MHKILTLFKRDYEGNRLVYNEVTEGCEWVLEGEGVATEKIDGTACLIQNGKLYKRYDCGVSSAVKRRGPPFAESEFKTHPPEWLAAEDAPDANTGHWPGWLPVGGGLDDQFHREAFQAFMDEQPHIPTDNLDGTYELVGPKVQGNAYRLSEHRLWKHGAEPIVAPRKFFLLREWLDFCEIEGVVWHHTDGRMAKMKKRDFGYTWPIKC